MSDTLTLNPEPRVVEPDVVAMGDPAWAEVGVTPRMVHYWSTLGHLLTVDGEANPGSGYGRRWPRSEVEVAGRIVRLRDAGVDLVVAAGVARAGHPVEVAPGIWIACTDPEDGAP